MSEFLHMSVSASVLILLTAAVRPWLSKRLPRLFFLLVWLLVLVRLLVPFDVPFAGSVYNLMPAEAELPQVAVTQQQPVIAEQYQEVQPPGVHHNHSELQMPWTVSMKAAVARVVWLAGALVCAAFLFGSHLASRRVYDTALPLVSPAVEEWLAAHPLRRTVRVAESDRISTPLTYGVLRPVLLLPRSLDIGDEATLHYVLTHEWVHIRRLDALWKLLLAAALCLHWFNPCVWLFCWLADRDLELACDEQVLMLLGGAHKKRYAQVLLDLEERRPLPMCSSFSHSLTAGRIRAIVDFRKPGFWMLAAAVVLAITAGALLLTSPAPISDAEQQLGDLWAESLASRDGEARAALMTEEYREQWQAVHEYNTIGVSSPWPVDWELAVDGDTMLVTYNTEDSGGGKYIYQEQLTLADTADGLRVADSTVTVDYLDSRLYQQVLDMAADTTGLHAWRADPLAVAAKFLQEDAGFAENVTLLEDDEGNPRRTVWQGTEGQTTEVMLYQPVLTVPDIWAVYSYSLGDHHYILHNTYIAPNMAEGQNTEILALAGNGKAAEPGVSGNAASLYISSGELTDAAVLTVAPEALADPVVVSQGDADDAADINIPVGEGIEVIKLEEYDPETGEIAKLYTKPELVTATVPEDGLLPSGLVWPVDADDISRGYDAGHSGVDIRGDAGSPVWAAADGTVLAAGFDKDSGNTVVIDHGDGRQTSYAHLAEMSVAVGDSVVTGQQIGTLGNTGKSTGAHLHFAVEIDGEPADPLTYGE